MCRDVLDHVAACRRWRRDRADLQGARIATRVWLRCLGLADSLRRDDCDLIGRLPMSALYQKRPYAPPQSYQPLLEVVANFRQQVARAERFRHAVITARCPRLLFF